MSIAEIVTDIPHELRLAYTEPMHTLALNQCHFDYGNPFYLEIYGEIFTFYFLNPIVFICKIHGKLTVDGKKIQIAYFR